MSKRLRLITTLIAAFTLYAGMNLTGFARATDPPGPCFPLEERMRKVDARGILHQCYCQASPTRGPSVKYCRWIPLTSFATYATQLTEWAALDAQLNYADIAETTSGYFSNKGENAHYYGSNPSDLPQGWLANATTVLRWNGSSWGTCRDSGFYYSGGAWSWLNVNWQFVTPPCGDGYYATNSYGFTWDGGGWQGSPSGIFSGYRYWSGCLQCLAATGTPPPPSKAPALAIRAPKGGPGPRPSGNLSATVPGLQVGGGQARSA